MPTYTPPKIEDGHASQSLHTTVTTPTPKANGDTHHSPTQHSAPSTQHSDHDEIPKDLPKPSVWALLLVLLIFVLTIIGLFVIGYIPTKHAEAQTKADAAARTGNLPSVAVDKPVLAQAAADVTLPCDIRADQQTALFPRSTGYIKTLNGIDVQTRVKKDQVLAIVETPEVDAQLAEAVANVAQGNAAVTKAQADLNLAKLSLDRYLTSQKNDAGSVSQQDIDTRQATYDQAVAALDQARANVKSLEAEVDRLKVLVSFEQIKAPFDGVITSRGYDVGALLSAGSNGSEIFNVAKTDKLRVYVSVPQSNATQIKIGQPAFIRVRNYPQREFKGIIARASESLNQTTRTEQFQIDVDNSDGALLPGMYGQVRLGAYNPKPALLIATSALIFNNGGSQVATVHDNKIHLQKVTVSRDLGTQLEIVDGLTPEDSIVTNPGSRIAEGAEVKVQRPQPQTADAKK